MSRINTPVNIKRLTNIVVMRLKKAGIRFEIACYPNKVQEWQKKIEKDLSEVLQVVTVFTNVGKGIAANEKELMSAFGTTDQHEICLIILAQGELQVSEKERKDQLGNTFRDVATIVSEKTINTSTGKPFSVGVIESALQEIHFSLQPNKSPKQLALLAIKLLKENSSLSIERAKLRLNLTFENASTGVSLKESEAASDWVLEQESTSPSGLFLWVVSVDPSHYRLIMDLVKKDGKLSLVEFASPEGGHDSGPTSSTAPTSSAPSKKSREPKAEEKEEEPPKKGKKKKN